MFKVAIQTFLKVLVALGAVFAALMFAKRYLEDKTDYIEIYNDFEDDDEELI